MEFWRKLKLRWDSNVTIVLDDYTARSPQELTVSKGQHVRIVQRQLSHAPDWCLIRVLNDHHQHHHHNQSSPSSLAASSTTITNVVPDLSLPSKYSEGLVPIAILKLTKSSSSNLQLPPPLTLPIITNKSEQDELSSKFDESECRSPPSTFQLNKRKSSFRRILKNPVRRLSLKDNSIIKDAKVISPTDFIASANTTLPEDNHYTDPVHKRPPLAFNSANSRKLKAFTFADTADLTSYPDGTAPINVVSALSASDFHIPAALSIETPPAEEISSMKMPSTSTITVISNDSQSEPTDEISYNDADQTTLSSFATIDEPVDDRTKYGEKRRHNIVELIETEKEYVKDLALIVEGYMNILENDKEIKKPTGLCGRERVVFGNVQRIYEFHRDTFLPQLEQCIENPNILGRLFTTNRFSPYVRYCENKPRSEYIVSEYHDYFEEIRKKLGQKLLVSDLLIKPVQRIMRYQLLLKEILKSTERMGDEPRAIRGALQVMIEVPQQANDMMNVGRIKDLPTNVHQLGELKLQDMLLVSEPITSKDTKDAEKKLKERRVFLFQQSMIFCDEIPAKDKYSSPNYIYKCELKINKLQHKEFKRNKELCQFTLVEVDAGNTRRVICQCKDDEQYELWVTNVNKVLQRQMDLIIALTNPTAALQKEQDSSTLSFTPSSRNQIKKAMSDRSSTFSEMSITSTANKPAEIPQKKTSLSFNLFDSILSRTTSTKPQSIRATKKKSPTYLSSTSCPQTSMEIPEQVRCLCNYNAIKDDEICVHKGDYVQILTTSQDNRWFVRHHIHRTTSSIQGWVPGFVLGRPNSNTSTNLSASTLPSSSRSANSLNQV